MVDPPQPSSLFVKGLGKSTTERHLQAVFSQFGEILLTQIAKHRSGRSAGFGVVTFTNHDAAVTAMAAMDNTILFGRRLVVKWFTAGTESNSTLNTVMPFDTASLNMQWDGLLKDSGRHKVDQQFNDNADYFGAGDVGSADVLANLVDAFLHNYMKQGNDQFQSETQNLALQDLHSAYPLPDAWAHVVISNSKKQTSAAFSNENACDISNQSSVTKPWNLGISPSLVNTFSSPPRENADQLKPGICTSDPVIEPTSNLSLSSQSSSPTCHEYAPLLSLTAQDGINRIVGSSDSVDRRHSCGASVDREYWMQQVANKPKAFSLGGAPALSAAMFPANTSVTYGNPSLLAQAQQLTSAQQQYAQALAQLNNAHQQMLKAAAAISNTPAPQPVAPSLSFLTPVEGPSSSADLKAMMHFIEQLAL